MQKSSVNAMLMLQDQAFESQEIPELEVAPAMLNWYVAHPACFRICFNNKE